ncbi:MAG: mycofactocin biosynthesis chaperone MftB [Solirubrobacteraceae bacterium]
MRLDGFELERAWRLDRRVVICPEPFGALAYHFGTRRLSFLKSCKLLAVVQALEAQPTASTPAARPA